MIENLLIRQLNKNDTQSFCNLIIDMYFNLDNLEWFSPMPYDFDSVKSIIENPRFYIIGVFDNDSLCAVSSFDYKCGKLIEKINFPTDCNTSKLVEIGFTMVHSKYQGHGIMKQMIQFLINKANEKNFEWIFSKVHKDNFASSKSFEKLNFKHHCHYSKILNKEEFSNFASQNFISNSTKNKAKQTLETFLNCDNIIVDYNIFIKDIRTGL